MRAAASRGAVGALDLELSLLRTATDQRPVGTSWKTYVRLVERVNGTLTSTSGRRVWPALRAMASRSASGANWFQSRSLEKFDALLKPSIFDIARALYPLLSSEAAASTVEARETRSFSWLRSRNASGSTRSVSPPSEPSKRVACLSSWGRVCASKVARAARGRSSWGIMFWFHLTLG